jgi:hypothetical protein
MKGSHYNFTVAIKMMKMKYNGLLKENIDDLLSNERAEWTRKDYC